MLYIYNKKELTFKRVVGRFFIINALSVIAIGGALYAFGRYNAVNSLTEYERDLIIYLDQKYFSEEQLIKELKSKNINKPHIVLAQTKIETGNFTSKIFKQNHNLFGMKKARIRPTTSLGIKRGHAYYDCWESSVEDYGYYQAYQGLARVDSDEEYFNLLSQLGYADDPNYIEKVKALSAKLKSKFE
jgi:hypothetical protein